MTTYAKFGYGTRLVTGSELVHGSQVRTYGRGRTCMAEGCGTRLSLYNPNARCSLHDHEAF